MRNDLRVEPVRAVSPDRRPPERDTPDRRRQEQDTFSAALQEAVEVEHGRRPNDSGA